ncbi:glycosyltransferase family 9 protein [Glaciimonas immobilis]|uniref:ADP-heptose:LPS heptosyltransferase n=1 Tax=Glaciimonas immobilis TaxID=728004 RepID=A0A840RV50_9BURK|nr:glycosyltransferase family 9 protein [Glaciimonas immobilis]KAF3999959.1 glycosyltransferase family 9 protein [Glaciimonas immobilis]MBB5200461.1 ADP-heptose:LPS heptosyltransferase [Glaciimonas immobilis]
MATQLVPADVLKKADKILFIAHLALGDFTYLQNCFKAFSEAYPSIKIHIWVDEVRRTTNAANWVHLKKYALYDWLAECPFIEKVYNQTYSPALFQQSIGEAQQQNYPLVVSLSTLRPPMYAALARQISPHGFVVGMKKSAGLLAFKKRSDYRKLDADLNPDGNLKPGMHISDVYAGWFEQLFGTVGDAPSRFPFVTIPPDWQREAKAQLQLWGFDDRSPVRSSSGKLLFINPYAKNNKRCWPLERVVELVEALQSSDKWRGTRCIVNVVPEEMAVAKQFFARYAMEQVRLFSAEENFFELPAMLKECDLIVSVETAVMHLANAVHVPVVALMRQKNPEWIPIDKENSIVITTSNRRHWVKAITVAQVMTVLINR